VMGVQYGCSYWWQNNRAVVVCVGGGGAVMDEVILQLVGNVRLTVLQELQQCTDA
jgi:hypothetical protein